MPGPDSRMPAGRAVARENNIINPTLFYNRLCKIYQNKHNHRYTEIGIMIIMNEIL